MNWVLLKSRSLKYTLERLNIGVIKYSNSFTKSKLYTKVAYRNILSLNLLYTSLSLSNLPHFLKFVKDN